MSLSVHIQDPSSPDFIDLLRPLLHPEISLTFGPIETTSADFQILVAGVPAESDLTTSAKIHTLIIPWSGLPKATRALMLRYPHVAVHNLHHNAAAVAEMALTLMLAAAKRLVVIDRTFRRHDWSPRYEDFPSSILAGKSVLIVGYGAIGRKIARICRGLDLKIKAIGGGKRSYADDIAEVYGIEALHELLPQTDILFITVPYTGETEGLIGRRELALLPEGSILVNVARGAIVDQEALYESLAAKRLSAGLDVWYRYPELAADRSDTAPADFPFADLDNVVMTPHLAGHSAEIEHLRAQAISELLNAAARGKPIPNRVDLKRGY